MNFLRDLSVLILGLGDSGLAMARWAQRCGAARVVVADSRTAPPQAAALSQDVPGAALCCGFAVERLDGVQLVLKSPGLSPLDPALAPLLAAAAARGVSVMGELGLFAQALADLKTARGYAPQVLAITGTNGKTTTTALTALLCERAGARTAMAGNIGPTLLDTLGAALDREPAAAAAVDAAESLSSEVEGSESAPSDDEWPEDAVPDETPALAALDGVTLAEVEAFAAEAPVSPEAAAPDATAPAADAASDLPEGGGPPPHLIPPPPPGPVFAHLPEVWVLELSSFQLEGVQGFLPTAATVLNITQDHLDWHGDMAAYAAAKARVFGDPAQGSQHGLWVLNRDDAAVMALRPQPPEPDLGARGRPLKAQPRWTPPASASFGLDAPRRAGDWGLVTEHGMAWLVRAVALDDAPPRGRRGAGAEASGEVSLQRLMPADALRIRGRHNAANALAALALASATGLPLAPMLHGLREYRGEPHRVEYLGNVGEVEAYDDSKGTNVGATVAALNGLGPEKAPRKLVLILGGEGKGQDFTPLVDAVAAHARAVALIGKDAPALLLTLAELARDGLPVHTHDSLEAATRWCFEQAQPGDAVLLSPACASLDMFRHYAHRAQVFADAVAQLAAERGEMSL